MRPLRLAPLLLALLSACGETEPVPAGETPPPPAGTTTGDVLTSAESTTGGGPCACQAPAQFCAAEYDPGQPAPAPEEFVCRDECLPPGAPGFWCWDDTSCCTGTCRPDGLCGSPVAETDDGTTTGEVTTGEVTTTGEPTTGTTDEGSTGTSTGEGTTMAGTSTGDAATGSSTGPATG